MKLLPALFALLLAAAGHAGSPPIFGSGGTTPGGGGGGGGSANITAAFTATSFTATATSTESTPGTLTCTVWPCPVYLDASATTGTGLSLPLHELQYEFTFGNSGAGTIVRGGYAFDLNRSGLAPFAGTRYAPATFTDDCGAGANTCEEFTITLTVWNAANESQSVTMTVRVIAPGTIFAGKAKCYHDGTLGSCPSWATDGGNASTTVNTALDDCDADDAIVLLKGGVTFTGMPSNKNIGSANQCVYAAYPIDGSGGRAILQYASASTATGFELQSAGGGNVFHNLDVKCPGTDSVTIFTREPATITEGLFVSNMNIGTAGGDRCDQGYEFQSGSAPLHKQLYAYQVDAVELGEVGGAGNPATGWEVQKSFYIAGTITGITGGSNLEHNLRIYRTDGFVVDTMLFGDQPSAKHLVTWRASAGEVTKRVVISRNEFSVDEDDGDIAAPLQLCASNNADADIRECYDSFVVQNIFRTNGVVDASNYIIHAPLTGGGASASAGHTIALNYFQLTSLEDGTASVTEGFQQQFSGMTNTFCRANTAVNTTTGRTAATSVCDFSTSSGNVCIDNASYVVSGGIASCGVISDAGNLEVTADPFNVVAGDPGSDTATDLDDVEITTGSAAVDACATSMIRRDTKARARGDDCGALDGGTP
jgi:hypothetical protein